jgi:TonB family protein
LSSCFDAESHRWTAQVSDDESVGLVPWLTIALAIHGAIAFGHRAAPKADAAPPAPLEVDLAQPAPAPVPTTPPRDEEPSAPAAARPVVHAARGARPEPAPAPARAGKVLTAGEATEEGDPISFVTDPEGRTYGGGVVARGGVADKSTETVRPAPQAGAEPPRSPAAETLTPPSDLSRRPKLDREDPCRGFFPSRADRDEGHVTLTVVVQATGAVGAVSVLSESPLGEGFGDSARACLASQRFEPALDRAGRPTRTATQVRIHFTR